MRHGLFHGDLHAGNLLVDPAGRIVFLDFGIMGRIDPRTRWLLRELIYALLVKKDHAAAGKIVVLLGAVGTTKPEAQAAKDLEAFAQPLTMKTLGDMSYADIGRQLSALADAYDVKLPRELVLIGKQFLYVERYMKLLAPKWQMMSDPQFSGYFANFMIEVTREHDSDLGRVGHRERRGLMDVRAGVAPSGDLEIHYEDIGEPDDPAVLLIMGLGAQLLLWRKGFCEKLVHRGLRVIRFDNRDVGLSSKLDGRRASGSQLLRHGPFVSGQTQPRRLHARGHGRRRRSGARSSRHRQGPRRRRVDGRHDRPGVRRPARRPNEVPGRHLLQQQPGRAAAAGAAGAVLDHQRPQARFAARGHHRQCRAGQPNYRQPGLSGS